MAVHSWFVSRCFIHISIVRRGVVSDSCAICIACSTVGELVALVLRGRRQGSKGSLPNRFSNWS